MDDAVEPLPWSQHVLARTPFLATMLEHVTCARTRASAMAVCREFRRVVRAVETPAYRFGPWPESGSPFAVSWRGSVLCAVHTDSTVRLYDPRTGDAWRMLSGPGAPARGVVLSPDGTTLAKYGWESRAYVVDVASGCVLSTCGGHDSCVWSADFSHGPGVLLLATASVDHAVRVFHAATGALLARLQHAAPVFAVKFSRSSTVLATGAGAPAGVALWCPESGARLMDFPPLGLGLDSVFGLSWSPDDTRLLVTSNRGRTAVVDASDGRCLVVSLPGPPCARPSEVTWAPGGRCALLNGVNGTVRAVDAWSGDEVACWSLAPGCESGITALACSPDGRAAVAIGPGHAMHVLDLGDCAAPRSGATPVVAPEDGGGGAWP